MEADGALARVERTLWTVWCFINDAVNRLIRPPPAPGTSGEQNPSQESAGEGKPPDCGEAEGDVHAGEDALLTVSLLNSPQTVVNGERSIDEANFKPDDAAAPQKTPSSKRSEGKEGEEAAEKEQGQTGRGDSELPVTEDPNQREEEETQSRPLHSREETSENDKHEQHGASKALTEDVISEKIQTTEDHQETSTDDDDKTHPEHAFEATGSEGHQRPITDLRPEENDNMHNEERDQQSDEVLRREEAGRSRIVLEVEADEQDFTDVVDGEKREQGIGPTSENDEARRSLDNRGESAIAEEGNEAKNTDKDPDAADSRCIPVDRGFAGQTQTSTTATVKLEGATRWEMSRELESIPPGTSEGRVVVFEELNTPACEETQEGLPESNNELGQDENTTQRFLEVEDYKELPEEVESGERDSPQNAEAARLSTSESEEEERESTGDPKTVRVVPHQDTESLQETEEQLFEEVIQVVDCRLQAELSESQMKTEVGDLRMVDGTEAYLFGFGIGEALPGSKDAGPSDHEARGAPAKEVTDETLKAEAPGVTRDFLHTTAYSNNSLENVPAAGCWSHSAESVAEVRHDGTANKSDPKNNMEGTCNRVLLGAEHEMQGRTETEPLAPMAGELITRSEEEENDFVKQYVLSTQVEAGEINNQFPPGTFEIESEISGIETADDFTIMASRVDLSDMSTGESTKHVTESEGSRSSISGHQDLIDEEILDLWIEAATSSQPNSQDDSVEETKTLSLLNQTSVGETGSHPGSEITATPMHQNSGTPQEETQKKRLKSAEAESGSQKDLDDKANDATGKPTEVTMSFFPPDGLLEKTSDSDEVTQSTSRQSTSSSEASSGEGLMCSESEKEGFHILPIDEQQSGDTAESSPDRSDGALEATAMLDDHTEVDAPVLDFTPQRSRISLKNPRVRPPNNPRYLLNMPSLEPTPSPVPVKPAAGVPFGGLGIGIKLPGLAAGFPLLKKTQRTVKDEDGQEIPSREAEAKPEEKGDRPEKEDAPHKPKWMPPKHPGFGNPLMSELKTKLKKTSNE